MLVGENGGAALTLGACHRVVVVVVIRDGAGWSYLWDGSQRYPAGAGAEGLLRAATALEAAAR
ncbi:hypothetical protein [Actinomadura viridis]|uniref:Metal-binding protein n=1 Tax=Actinomadura viridis TaxID=58110 RepID=A0A931DVL3_9ACTN|nr:hypothetical protein [Actinomadura viridis]MBG6093533.1 putative metal-binding protein [Actinomadura viridis]